MICVEFSVFANNCKIKTPLMLSMDKILGKTLSNFERVILGTTYKIDIHIEYV